MAVDKKSDHYTSAEGYTDLDGQSKRFTFVDHDKKTKISTMTSGPDPDWEKKCRARHIERITSLPASICPPIFTDYTLRGDREEIEWNVDMLLDAGVPLKQLGDLCTLLENKAEMLGLTK